jgi:membrane-associated phospholipid phosphatase
MVVATAVPRDRRTVGTALRLFAIGVVALAAMVGVYLLSTFTTRAQVVENALLEARGNQLRGGPTTAVEILATVSGWSLVAAIGMVTTVALVRGRPRLALGAGAVVACSILTTELLKKVILPRPRLDPSVVPWHVDNIFPSGHTTIATAVAVAFVLVVPYRLRGVAALVGGFYAAGVAVATLDAGWHRTSDALGAILLVLGTALCACGALVWWRGPGHPPAGDGRARRGRLAYVPIALAAAVAGTVSIVGVPRIMREVDAATLAGARVQEAYAVTLTLVALAVALAMAVLLLALDDVSLDQPAEARRAPRRSPEFGSAP